MVRFLLTTSLLLFAPILTAATPATLPGGYSQADISEQAVIDAANFAANQIDEGSLVAIKSAQTQVVAGVNYKIVFEIAADDDEHYIYEAVVFLPLPNTGLPMQLTSYKDLGVVTTTY